MAINIQELLGALPADLKPIALKYAPVVQTWTIEEIWAWIDMLTTDQAAAYQKLLKGLPDANEALLAQWDAQIKDMAQINIKHSARKKVAAEAMGAVLNAILQMLLPLVSL